MPFYEWSESMSVGVPLIDSDHRALIDLINRLHDALEYGAGPSDMDQVFQSLVAYIEFHFAREEAVLAACGYPSLAEHQAEHDRFTADMRYTRDRYFSGGEAGLGPHLLAFLKDWLNNHILVEDMAYRPFLEDVAKVERAALRFGPGLSDPDPTPPPPRPAGP